MRARLRVKLFNFGLELSELRELKPSHFRSTVGNDLSVDRKHVSKTFEATVLVLDGHDAAGKTTLATMLAKSVGGVHVRPFAGDVGERFVKCVNEGEMSQAADIAKKAIKRALCKVDAPVLVFDRHWMTAFSLLGESYWKAWQPLPATTLCWADLRTTLSRLRCRPVNDMHSYDHQHFLEVYQKLAQRFGCNIVRTDILSVEESFELVYSWAKALIAKA